MSWSITPSCSTGCPYPLGSRDQHSTGCGHSSSVAHRQFTTVDLSRVAQWCVLVWRRARCSALSSTSSIRPIFRDWSYRSGSACICMLTIHSFLARVSLQMPLIWLPEPWTTLDVINSVKTWMLSNRLRLNANKTQFIWLGTSHFLGRRDMQAVSSILQSSDVVNNLGVYLDLGLVMDRQVSKLCQVCYFHLRQLRTVRRSLTKESLLTLVHASVTSRVNHCNGLLFGSHSYLLDRLQSVLNSAARLVLNIPKFSHISAAIRDKLLWLPIRRRIDFKIALMFRHCLVGAVPEYLMEMCHPVGSAVGRQCRRSASRGDLVVMRFRLQTFGHRAFAVSGPPNLELSSAQDQTIA